MSNSSMKCSSSWSTSASLAIAGIMVCTLLATSLSQHVLRVQREITAGTAQAEYSVKDRYKPQKTLDTSCRHLALFAAAAHWLLQYL